LLAICSAALLYTWRVRAVLLVCVSALGACTRPSAPRPAADSVAAPAPSVATAAAEPIVVATSSAPATPSQQPPRARPAVSGTAAPASSSPAAAEDCARLEASAEYSELSAEERARSLATCQAKQEFRAFVAARQSCSAERRCEIVPGSCPFGCFVPVAQAAAAEVAAKLDALGARLDKAGNRCVYRCMSPPAAACVDGRCSASKP
jgi:hypothetical protein